MSEYIGYKDTIGNGMFNMGITDEEIVRCRDCKYCGDDYVSGGRNFFCERFERRAYAMGYCAWGEKR